MLKNLICASGPQKEKGSPMLGKTSWLDSKHGQSEWQKSRQDRHINWDGLQWEWTYQGSLSWWQYTRWTVQWEEAKLKVTLRRISYPLEKEFCHYTVNLNDLLGHKNVLNSVFIYIYGSFKVPFGKGWSPNYRKWQWNRVKLREGYRTQEVVKRPGILLFWCWVVYVLCVFSILTPYWLHHLQMCSSIQ